MWIVRLALRRPYTFIVMALLIAIGGVLTIARTAIGIAADLGGAGGRGWEVASAAP